MAKKSKAVVSVVPKGQEMLWLSAFVVVMLSFFVLMVMNRGSQPQVQGVQTIGDDISIEFKQLRNELEME